MREPTVLALDIGTSAVKAGVVAGDRLIGPPQAVSCAPTYGARTTLDPAALMRATYRALAAAVRAARGEGAEPGALAVVSQAQTFVTVDAGGVPVGPLVSWLDNGGAARAGRFQDAFPDYAARTGFFAPSGRQFAAKAGPPPDGGRVLLINEFVISQLTGQANGDTTHQGMGGLFDIGSRRWWPDMLAQIGLSPRALAEVAPAGAIRRPLGARPARRIGCGPVPVLSCGLDQSAAAAGAGIGTRAALTASFGTALVVYARSDAQPIPASPDQIAGIDPLTGRYFILGLESDCGNVLRGLAGLLFRGTMGELLDAAAGAGRSEAAPTLHVEPDGRFAIAGMTPATRRADVAAAAVERYAAVFARLVHAVAQRANVEPIVAVGGGLSRSRRWLDRMSAVSGLHLVETGAAHPGLVGAAIIARAALARPSE
jgi:sugar (pentulose or hexulose) kinase